MGLLILSNFESLIIKSCESLYAQWADVLASATSVCRVGVFMTF